MLRSIRVTANKNWARGQNSSTVHRSEAAKVCPCKKSKIHMPKESAKANAEYTASLPRRSALVEVEVLPEAGIVGVSIDALHPAVKELVQAERFRMASTMTSGNDVGDIRTSQGCFGSGSKRLRQQQSLATRNKSDVNYGYLTMKIVLAKVSSWDQPLYAPMVFRTSPPLPLSVSAMNFAPVLML